MISDPSQLRLAAEIVEGRLPWEMRYSPTSPWLSPRLTGGMEWRTPVGFLNAHAVGFEIRKKEWQLPTPPAGKYWHNPDGLTDEQFGDGYRPLLPEEVDGRFSGKAEMWMPSAKWNAGAQGNCQYYTYRVPVSTSLLLDPPPPVWVPWTIEEINERVGQVVISKHPSNPSPSVILQTHGVMVWVGAEGPQYPGDLLERYTMRDGLPCGKLEAKPQPEEGR